MALHWSYSLTKDHSISLPQLVLKLDNLVNSIKSDYFMLVSIVAILRL